jgi:hypothetical protein
VKKNIMGFALFFISVFSFFGADAPSMDTRVMDILRDISEMQLQAMSLDMCDCIYKQRQAASDISVTAAAAAEKVEIVRMAVTGIEEIHISAPAADAAAAELGNIKTIISEYGTQGESGYRQMGKDLYERLLVLYGQVRELRVLINQYQPHTDAGWTKL